MTVERKQNINFLLAPTVYKNVALCMTQSTCLDMYFISQLLVVNWTSDAKIIFTMFVTCKLPLCLSQLL